MIRVSVCLLLALASLSGAPSPAADPAATLKERVAGDYELRGVMETASGLRLSPNGTYRFFLSYGMIDERDEGAWHIDGSTIVLNSTAPATPPAYVFVSSSRESFPGVRVSFTGETARAAAVLTRGLLVSNGREISLRGSSDDSLLARDAAGPVQRIKLVLLGTLREYPVYEHEPGDPTHNQFVFRVIPGNYGYVRFDAVPLRIGDDELHLKTPQMVREFRYVRLAK